MRIDKYIWYTRKFKSRSLASRACNNEKVLVNNNIARPSKIIKINDVISIKKIPIWRCYKVIDFPINRIGANLMNDYIKETTSKKDLEKLHEHEKLIRENKNLNIKGRPTKKDRRNLKKFTT